MKDDSFDCTLIAHLRIFLLFYRLLYCLILPENRLFFGIWKVVEIEGDQLTVTLEAWSDPSTYTFSVDGNSLTMNENSGYGISGTFTKK